MILVGTKLGESQRCWSEPACQSCLRIMLTSPSCLTSDLREDPQSISKLAERRQAPIQYTAVRRLLVNVCAQEGWLTSTVLRSCRRPPVPVISEQSSTSSVRLSPRRDSRPSCESLCTYWLTIPNALAGDSPDSVNPCPLQRRGDPCCPQPRAESTEEEGRLRRHVEQLLICLPSVATFSVSRSTLCAFFRFHLVRFPPSTLHALRPSFYLSSSYAYHPS